MQATTLLVLYFGYFVEAVSACVRIMTGNATTINRYPSAASVLLLGGGHPIHICGGVILNDRHILTSAHCFMVPQGSLIEPELYLIRVGSTLAHTGGITYEVENVVFHPNWTARQIDSDIAVVRTTSKIIYTKKVQPAYIAGANYLLRDNASVWAIGWGFAVENGNVSVELRHAKVFNINKEICQERYRRNIRITENMLCSGWLDVGGSGLCTRDAGSPLYHKDVLVGISSIGLGCAKPCYPGINVKVARFIKWIQDETKRDRINHEISNQASLSTNIFFNWKSMLKILN